MIKAEKTGEEGQEQKEPERTADTEEQGNRIKILCENDQELEANIAVQTIRLEQHQRADKAEKRQDSKSFSRPYSELRRSGSKSFSSISTSSSRFHTISGSRIHHQSCSMLHWNQIETIGNLKVHISIEA